MVHLLEASILLFQLRHLIYQDLLYTHQLSSINNHSNNLCSCKWLFVHQMLLLHLGLTRIQRPSVCPSHLLEAVHQGCLPQEENQHRCLPLRSKGENLSLVPPLLQRNRLKSNALELQRLGTGAQGWSRLRQP